MASPNSSQILPTSLVTQLYSLSLFLQKQETQIKIPKKHKNRNQNV